MTLSAVASDIKTEPSLLPQMTPEEMLSCLESVIRQDYPAIPADPDDTSVRCTVKYVDDSLQPFTAPAFRAFSSIVD